MADIKITDLVDQQAFDQLQKLQQDIDSVEQQYTKAARVLIQGLKVKVEVVGDLDKLTTIANSGIQQAAQATQNLTRAVQQQTTAVGQTTNVISRELSEVEKLNKAQRQQVDLDKDAVSMAREIVGTYQQQVQNLARVETELKAVSKQKKDLDDQYKSGAITQAQYQSQLASVIAKERELKGEKTEIQQLMSIEEKMNQAVKGSYKELAQQLNMLEQAYMRLTEDEKQSPFGKRLAEAQIELKQHMKDLDADMGNFQRNVGDYAIAGASLKSQLKDLVMEIATLTVEYRNMSDEERNSAAGEELANKIAQLTEEAGNLKDVIADTNAAIGNAASDTRGFDQLNDALQTVTGTFAVLKGAAVNLGICDEDLAACTNKLTAVIAVLNGLQAIQNKLQEQSALMQGVRTVQTKAATIAEKLDTAAKSENIIVSKAATAAQAMFNKVASANPYTVIAVALGLVIAAMIKYAISSRKAAKAEKEHQEAVERNKKAIEEKNATMKKAQDEYAETISKIKMLVLAAKDENRSLKERNAACKELNEMEPSIQANINGTTGAFSAQQSAIDSLIGHLEAYYKMLAAQDYLKDLYKQQIELQVRKVGFDNWLKSATIDVNRTKAEADAIDRKNQEYVDNVTSGMAGFTETSIATQTAGRTADRSKQHYHEDRQRRAQSAVDNVTAQLNEIGATISTAESVLADLTAKNGGWAPPSTIKSAGSGKSDAQREQEELAKKALEEQKRLNELQLANISDEETKEIAILNDKYAEQRQIIEANYAELIKKTKEGSQERTNLESQQADALTLLQQQTCAEEEAINKKYNDARTKAAEEAHKKEMQIMEQQYAQSETLRNQQFRLEQVRLKKQLADGLITKEQYDIKAAQLEEQYAIDTANANIAYLEKVLSSENLTDDERLKYATKLAEAKIALADATTQKEIENINRTKEADKKTSEERRKNAQAVMQASMDCMNAVADLASNIFEGQMQELEKKSEANSAANEAEIANIEALEEKGAISKEEAESRKRAANAKSKAQEEQIAKEKAALELKQAKLNKAMSIMTISLNTAMAVMNALATAPWPMNIVMAALAGTTGALQLAAAIAEPLPTYKDGTTFHPGGPAIVGDGGKVEGVLLPNGKAFLTPDSPTMVNLPAGAKVIPDASTLNLDGLNPTPLVSVARSSDGSPIIINDYNDLQREIAKGNSLTKQMMKQQAKIARDQRYAAYIASRM